MAKGLVRYLLFLIILFMLTLLLDTYPMYVVSLAYCAAGFVSLLVYKYAASRISLLVLAGREGSLVGEAAEVFVEVRNESLIPVSLIMGDLCVRNSFYGEASCEEVLFQAAPVATNRTGVKLVSQHAGHIVGSLKNVYAYDIFRICRFRIKVSGTAELLVFPDLDAMNNSGPDRVSESEMAKEYAAERRGSDVSELFDIREYRQGDSVKQLHHKLSLKMDTLMVKEFGDSDTRIPAVFLYLPEKQDTAKTLSHFDKVCGRLAGISVLMSDTTAIDVVWYDSRVSDFCVYRMKERRDVGNAIRLVSESGPTTAGTDIAEKLARWEEENGRREACLVLGMEE